MKNNENHIPLSNSYITLLNIMIPCQKDISVKIISSLKNMLLRIFYACTDAIKEERKVKKERKI